MGASKLELEFIFQLRAINAPPFETEYKFHPSRRWRFDIAFPDHLLAIEIEGGIWTGGRHTRGKGFEKDCEKYNTAALLGWTVLRFTGGMIKSGMAIQSADDIMIQKGMMGGLL